MSETFTNKQENSQTDVKKKNQGVMKDTLVK